MLLVKNSVFHVFFFVTRKIIKVLAFVTRKESGRFDVFCFVTRKIIKVLAFCYS